MQLPGVRQEFPQEKSNFQGLGSSKHNVWGHWAIPVQLALPQCRGKSGSIVPWQDGMGDRAGSEVQHQHPIGLEFNYPKKPTISFIKVHKGFIKA